MSVRKPAPGVGSLADLVCNNSVYLGICQCIWRCPSSAPRHAVVNYLRVRVHWTALVVTGLDEANTGDLSTSRRPRFLNFLVVVRQWCPQASRFFSFPAFMLPTRTASNWLTGVTWDTSWSSCSSCDVLWVVSAQSTASHATGCTMDQLWDRVHNVHIDILVVSFFSPRAFVDIVSSLSPVLSNRTQWNDAGQFCTFFFFALSFSLSACGPPALKSSLFPVFY